MKYLSNLSQNGCEIPKNEDILNEERMEIRSIYGSHSISGSFCNMVSVLCIIGSINGYSGGITYS